MGHGRQRMGWLVMGLLLLAAGCAGKDFARPAPETLVLGKTTYAEINARFGSPYREGSLMARAIVFSFLDQVLVPTRA